MPRVRESIEFWCGSLKNLRRNGKQSPEHRGLSVLLETAALYSSRRREADRLNELAEYGEDGGTLTDEEEEEIYDRVDFETAKGQYYGMPQGIGRVGQAQYFALCDMRGLGWKIPRKLKKQIFGTDRRNEASWRDRMTCVDSEHHLEPYRGWTWQAFQKFRFSAELRKKRVGRKGPAPYRPALRKLQQPSFLSPAPPGGSAGAAPGEGSR